MAHSPAGGAWVESRFASTKQSRRGGRRPGEKPGRAAGATLSCCREGGRHNGPSDQRGLEELCYDGVGLLRPLHLQGVGGVLPGAGPAVVHVVEALPHVEGRERLGGQHRLD
eukprot:EG_transcript_45901